MVPAALLMPDLTLELAPGHRAHHRLTLRAHVLCLPQHPCVAERMFSRAHCAVANVFGEVPGVREDLCLGNLGEGGDWVDAACVRGGDMSDRKVLVLRDGHLQLNYWVWEG